MHAIFFDDVHIHVELLKLRQFGLLFEKLDVPEEGEHRNNVQVFFKSLASSLVDLVQSTILLITDANIFDPPGFQFLAKREPDLLNMFKSGTYSWIFLKVLNLLFLFN